MSALTTQPFDERKRRAWWAGLAVRYWRYPYVFMTETCFTIDPVNKEHPIALIPPKPHLEIFVREYLSDDPLQLYPKSRRLLITWGASVCNLHLVMVRQGAAIFVVSKKQADSDRIVNRHRFIYEHLPEELPKPHMHVRMGKGGFATRLEFRETESSITALDERPNSLRQEGATLLHIEEFGFWKPGWAEQAYGAMLPTIEGGGRARIICSAQGLTFWKKLVYDETITAQGIR